MSSGRYETMAGSSRSGGQPSTLRASDETWQSDGQRSPFGRSSSGHTEEHNETGRTETNKYAVIYEPTRTGYSAYAPDLPGCIATGQTIEQTRERMHEAIEVHLNSMRE